MRSSNRDRPGKDRYVRPRGGCDQLRAKGNIGKGQAADLMHQRMAAFTMAGLFRLGGQGLIAVRAMGMAVRNLGRMNRVLGGMHFAYQLQARASQGTERQNHREGDLDPERKPAESADHGVSVANR